MFIHARRSIGVNALQVPCSLGLASCISTPPSFYPAVSRRVYLNHHPITFGQFLVRLGWGVPSRLPLRLYSLTQSSSLPILDAPSSLFRVLPQPSKCALYHVLLVQLGRQTPQLCWTTPLSFHGIPRHSFRLSSHAQLPRPHHICCWLTELMRCPMAPSFTTTPKGKNFCLALWMASTSSSSSCLLKGLFRGGITAAAPHPTIPCVLWVKSAPVPLLIWSSPSPANLASQECATMSTFLACGSRTSPFAWIT